MSAPHATAATATGNVPDARGVLGALLAVGPWLWRDWAVDESGAGLAEALFLSLMHDACRLRRRGAATDGAARAVLQRCARVLFRPHDIFDASTKRILLRPITDDERATRPARREDLQQLQRSIVTALQRERASRHRHAPVDAPLPPPKRARVDGGNGNGDDDDDDDDDDDGEVPPFDGGKQGAPRVVLQSVEDPLGPRAHNHPDHWTDMLQVLQQQNHDLRVRLEVLDQTSRSRIRVLQQQLADSQAQLTRMRNQLTKLAAHIDQNGAAAAE